MNDEQIRIAVAEEMGYSRYIRPYDGKVFLCKEPPISHWKVTTTRGVDCIENEVSNYLFDLNACAEFERSLNKSEHWSYINHLVDLTGAEWTDAYEEVMVVLLATPRQRCEAFLRVKDKWNDKIVDNDVKAITLTDGNGNNPKVLNKEDYELLKSTGMLWELHPDAPQNWPY